jgi:DNA-binding CsgD family transcriptional regulator
MVRESSHLNTLEEIGNQTSNLNLVPPDSRTIDGNSKRLVIYLSEEDFSRLQSLSACTTIPLPILCRVLLRQVVSRLSPEDGLDDLLLQLSCPLIVTSLSNREMDILNLMVQGISNGGIAHTLGLSQQTVKNHVTSILRKMKAKNSTQAALLALKRNLVQVETHFKMDLRPPETVRTV